GLVTAPGSTPSAPAAAARLAIGPPRPNPVRSALRQSVTLTKPARGEWALFDLAGRRVATLWRGPIPAGGFELSASVPVSISSGLYFTRLALDGREQRTDRLAVIR